MAAPEIHGTCDARFARVRDLFTEQLANPDELGAAVAVTFEGRPVVDLWAGHADLERKRAWRQDTIVNLFSKWYSVVGMEGCSSHSGRRTFITNAARKISTVGGSLRDVQLLAGHSNLRTTQGYIEADAEAQRRIVQLI